MKTNRILCLTLALFLLLSLVSCGGLVTGTAKTEPSTVTDGGESAPVTEVYTGAVLSAPFEASSYALPEGASPDQIRAMAIKAMRDGLTIKWIPSKAFKYRKDSGAHSDKDFVFDKNKIYAGLPYTTGGNSLFHWLQYYDSETGVIDVSNFSALGSSRLGNSCSAAVSWGWAAVCNVVPWVSTYELTQVNGCIPVGTFHYDSSLKSFTQTSTKTICTDNGEAVMFASYAAVKPADALISAGDGSSVHAMMSIANAHVEYTGGKIDGEKSYITLQDQAAGRDPVSEDDPNAATFGSTSKQMSFQKLFSSSYLPVTNAMFLGQAPYEKAAATYKGAAEDGTKAAVGTGSIESNFRIISVTAVITGGDGKETVRKTSFLGNNAYTASLSNLAFTTTLNRNLVAGQGYHYELKILVATGETLGVCGFDFTA